jgi:hypothetical protein
MPRSPLSPLQIRSYAKVTQEEYVLLLATFLAIMQVRCDGMCGSLLFLLPPPPPLLLLSQAATAAGVGVGSEHQLYTISVLPAAI